MRYPTIAATLILAFAAQAPAEDPFDPNAAKLRIANLTTMVGEVIVYARACRVRDEDWLAELEDQMFADAVAPDTKFGAEVIKRESDLADSELKLQEGYANFRLTQAGGARICATLRQSPELKAADAMVDKQRQPKDWSGIVPVAPQSGQKP